MLGAPPAFVLSQDQTLYKWYLITYKVLNLCKSSDTIACVLSNYLFLELFIVFFPNTFKVPQVSVLFNFQGPVPTVSRGQLVYYISFSSVCQELFWRFFWNCPAVRPVLLEAALPHQNSLFILPHPKPFVKDFFRGFSLRFRRPSERVSPGNWASRNQEQVSLCPVYRLFSGPVARDSLTIIHLPEPNVNTFFEVFR